MSDEIGMYYSVEETMGLVNQIQKGVLITIGVYLVAALAVSAIFFEARGFLAMAIFGPVSCLAVVSVCARARIEIKKRVLEAAAREVGA